MYSRYSLSELTAHLIGLLERRRTAFEIFDEEAEAALQKEATSALDVARAAFAEMADDPVYWERTERTVLTVALPRYLNLARAQHTLEHTAYGAWRGGDVLSRIAYAGMGLVTGIIVIRTAIPDWLEPLPIGLFFGGPLLPDLHAWWAKRGYAKSLEKLVHDMADEQRDVREYQPLLAPEPAKSKSEPEPSSAKTPERTRD